MSSFTTYEEVKNQSTEEYFNGNQFSIDAFNRKYKLNTEETYVKSLKRVCDAIASVEDTEEKRKYWSERWFDEIYNDWWHPAGSIMQGAGSNRNISLANCTHISLGVTDDLNNWDNLESIVRNTAYTVAKCAAYRQGLGVEFSKLRPKKTSVYNSANESTGSIHWMKFIDSLGYYVGQFGRRPAFLFSLSCSHPDIEEFITCKSDYTKIQNANISVQCTDAFYEAVENNSDWELFFEIPEVKKGQKVYVDVHSRDKDTLQDNKGYYYLARTSRPYEKISHIVKARKILELIAKHMTLNAEPGIQNIDIARRYSNSDYVYDEKDEYSSKIIGTNACVVGETEVLTKNGYLRIDSLVDQEVEIWNGFEWSKVIPKITNYNQKVLKITCSDGRQLVCTYYHKFHIAKDYWGKKEIKSANQLSINDKIIKHEFPILNEGANFDFAYEQGFYSGDGTEGLNQIWLYSPKFCVQNRLIGKYSNTFQVHKSLQRKSVELTFETLPKDFVPMGWNLGSKLNWLAGLFDADGTELKEGGLQLVSINLSFLQNLQTLLSTLGIQTKVLFANDAGYRLMPDGQGGTKDYYCQETNRICIGAKQIQDLVQLGLNCERLKFNKTPNRDASQFVKIVKIEDAGIAPVVYCFNELKNHTAIFNGIITGQCSEQYLSRDSLCVLASANAGKFSTKPEEYKLQLERVGTSINRFLDNVNEYELKNGTYATPHQKLAIQKLRRTGAGYANLVEWLLKQDLGYGTKNGNIAVEEFTKWYNYYLYKSSINLGKEKGSFGLFNRKKLEKSPFIQRLMELGLEFTHLRNVTCSSIAPTGSLLLMFSYLCLSYGIEPAFDLYFWKRTRISGKYEYYFCVPRIVRDLFKSKGIDLPIQSDTIKDTWDGKYGRPVAEMIEQHRKLISSNFRKATDVPPIEKLDLMAKVMKWIDSSISVTYLLPENANWKDVYDFILEANKREVKSIAAFPDKKMYGIVSFVPFKDLAFKLTEEGVSIHDQNFTDEELKELNVSRENINIQNNAPKRLKSLKCDLHYITHNNENYLAVVGIQNGVPYEVFGGHIRSNSKLLQDKPKQGTITRNGQGNYSLELDDIKIEHFNTTFTPFEQTIFRLSSTMMRHGVPIQYVVEQLGKAAKDVHSIESIIARVLKKYIKDGQKISGKECPSCKSTDLVYQEGCVTCSKCNWSKCS